MATWVEPIDTETDPDAPLTAQLGKRWDNNVIAAFDGETGAPRLAYAAGTIGSFVFGRGPVAAYGDLVAGSTIFPTSAVQALNDGGATVNGVFNSGSALSGSWQCLGDSNAGVWGSGTAVGATLWQRVA